MLFSLCVFLVVIGLLAFCLTESKGKNTVHARKSRPRVPSQIKTRSTSANKDQNVGGANKAA